jgi:hypothetical protein
MLEFYEPGAATIEDSVAKTVERVNNQTSVPWISCSVCKK